MSRPCSAVVLTILSTSSAFERASSPGMRYGLSSNPTRTCPPRPIAIESNFHRAVGLITLTLPGLDAATTITKEREVLGSQGYADSYGRGVEMIRSWAIDTVPMVSHDLPLDEPSAGLRLLDNPDVEKAKVVMTRNPPAESSRLLH